jgi:hypothetical protein
LPPPIDNDPPLVLMVTFDDGLVPFRDTLPPAVASLSAQSVVVSAPEALLTELPENNKTSFVDLRVIVDAPTADRAMALLSAEDGPPNSRSPVL